jgi:hypothetical protein
MFSPSSTRGNASNSQAAPLKLHLLSRSALSAQGIKMDKGTGLPENLNGFDRIDDTYIDTMQDIWTLYRRHQSSPEPEDTLSVLNVTVMLGPSRVSRALQEHAAAEQSSIASIRRDNVIVYGDDPRRKDSERFWVLQGLTEDTTSA